MIILKIDGHVLDKNQEYIVFDKSKYLLVVAGAGSGKTLTILGKIKYLIDNGVLPNEILCISFTRASSNNLKEKIKTCFNIDTPVYTFHKLALEILKKQKLDFDIIHFDLLEEVIDNFFKYDAVKDENMIKNIFNYFNLKKVNYEKFYNDNIKNINLLKKLIYAFIHLFKSNNYDVNSFIHFKKKILSFNFKRYKKEKSFLILAFNIYLLYQKKLEENNFVDFDDLIIKAINCVDNLTFSYKYIIIDEYQDTSYIRFKLIYKIIEKTNSNLMVVGDDFQSIYRFTGCDISLFLNFENYFKNAIIKKINNTYRNSNELVHIAGDFVMKNKKQIYKDLKSIKNLKNPIKIFYYEDSKNAFENLINKIYNETKSSILVLGRNNNDIYDFLNENFKYDDNLIYLKDKDIKIKYMTIHKSKGLEDENVIVINMIDKLLGFPTKIKDDRILRLVTSNYDKYPYSEERRLFYVALTRTKNYVYLMVPIKNESIFIKEIKDKCEIIYNKKR